MLGMFKNPYKNSAPYPTVTKAQEAVSKYCKEMLHPLPPSVTTRLSSAANAIEVYRGYESGSRESDSIKCNAAKRDTIKLVRNAIYLVIT